MDLFIHLFILALVCTIRSFKAYIVTEDMLRRDKQTTYAFEISIALNIIKSLR